MPSKVRPLTQLKINWALFGSALVIALPTVLAITPSPITDMDSKLEGAGQDESNPRKSDGSNKSAAPA
jgi:hypothetical protein